MANTFGVRLGGIDRVALYGQSLGQQCVFLRFHFAEICCLQCWMMHFCQGVVDGHGECGEVCAAFVRTGSQKRWSDSQEGVDSVQLCTAPGRHLPTQLAQSRHFSEGRGIVALCFGGSSRSSCNVLHALWQSPPDNCAGQLESALVEAFVQTDLLQQSAGLVKLEMLPSVAIGQFLESCKHCVAGLPLWASGACVTAAAAGCTACHSAGLVSGSNVSCRSHQPASWSPTAAIADVLMSQLLS